MNLCAAHMNLDGGILIPQIKKKIQKQTKQPNQSKTNKTKQNPM